MNDASDVNDAIFKCVCLQIKSVYKTAGRTSYTQPGYVNKTMANLVKILTEYLVIHGM